MEFSWQRIKRTLIHPPTVDKCARRSYTYTSLRKKARRAAVVSRWSIDGDDFLTRRTAPALRGDRHLISLRSPNGHVWNEIPGGKEIPLSRLL